MTTMSPQSATPIPFDATSFYLAPTLRALIARRWQEWLPLSTIASQHDMFPATGLEYLRVSHSAILAMLIRIHRVEMRVIRRLALDDPRPGSRESRTQELNRYLDRRSRRINKKGIPNADL